MSKILLKECAYYVSEKISVSTLSSRNYIGVDNMLPNKGGVTFPESVPTSGDVTAFKIGDVLIGNIRPYFKKIWLATFNGGCSPDVLCIRCNSNMYSEYLFSVLSQDAFFDYAMAGSKGSKMPRGDKNHIMNYPISIIDNIKKIGDFIVNINAKISNNNRINVELESMAKTIYDYWFTQFDFPDENGMPYRSAGGAMIWNGQVKREIPVGWQVTSITDNALFQIIKPGISNFKGNKTYLATADIIGTTVFKGNRIDYDTRESRANMQPTTYSVWFAKMKNSIKHFNLGYKMKSIIDNYIFSTGFCGLQCSQLSFEYVASFIEHSYFEVIKDTLAHGATQEAVNNDDLCNIFLLKPSDAVLQLYHERTNGIYAQISINICENQKLSELRDWLLPMLMNGQVGFKEKREEKPQIKLSGFEKWLATQGYAARGDVDMDVLRDIYEAMDSDDK